MNLKRINEKSSHRGGFQCFSDDVLAEDGRYLNEFRLKAPPNILEVETSFNEEAYNN